MKDNTQTSNTKDTLCEIVQFWVSHFGLHEKVWLTNDGHLDVYTGVEHRKESSKLRKLGLQLQGWRVAGEEAVKTEKKHQRYNKAGPEW